jgi:glutamine---fructose-6-phosphate transaminase (isomerizing)
MCGIVGYYGPREPKDVILAGLKRLEYRGYDSAGVAILDKGSFERVRAEGKLVNLEEKLRGRTFDGRLGIGHTRWATHGAPTERNAHPHVVDGISLVHNGIIENYMELKSELDPETHFSSETDSELVAHLIAQEVRRGKKLLAAVLAVRPRLQGAYSILVISKDEPDQMVAFKDGPPLVLGLAPESTLVASDVQAVIPYTRKVIYLEDMEVAHVKGTDVKIMTADGKILHKEPVLLDWTAERAEKEGFSHFMLKEIFEQPRAVAQALQPHLDPGSFTVKFVSPGLNEARLKKVERITIVACGTSYYAGLAGKYMLETMSRLPVEIEVASEYRYRDPVVQSGTLAIVISQSGETADTLAALRFLKKHDVPVLSICNVKGSSIDRDADGHVYMNSGLEVGVASTKAFTSTLAILNAFSLQMAKWRGVLSHDQEHGLVKNLLAVPSLMETTLAYDRFFRDAAKDLSQYKGFLYMGRGIHYSIALEGALKLKELAYMHAEGYAAGEMKHGPLALIDKDMAVVVVAPKDSLYEKTLSNLEEAKARGGQIISLGTGHDERLKRLSVHFLSIPEAHWSVNPILEVIPLQLLAFHVAKSLGHDVDQPRNLAKSVTVE